MITVIADDITGAAEIAGIGFRYGLRVNLITNPEPELPACDMLVYATDTRSMTEAEAIAETQRVARYLHTRSGICGEIFKKTDSALRGHVKAELEVLMQTWGCTCALFLPENPSKGRVVKDGVYYIGKDLLHCTSFVFDPEFPATSSLVEERLPGILSLRVPDQLPQTGIWLADAATAAEVRLQLGKWRKSVLLAGAADCFEAYLQQKGYCLQAREPYAGMGDRRALVVCGSTQSRLLGGYPYVVRQHALQANMPLSVFEGGPASAWVEHLRMLYATGAPLIVGIGHPSKGGKDVALRLRTTLAQAVDCLMADHLPDELVIEGGATAFAILQTLGWHHFRLTDEVAPGVIRMEWENEHPVGLVLKPGSYSWGDLFQ